ncbi:hypothetical protein AYI70_g283 [Smittium culicis]|uniref:Uncharacterized protein n=1 Tax=Smittium culicis TaxID=133412 RepID=A0A1R1YHA7_9FUNG|nr:hypothetical protein AYI70_g283 [Smittium culicis]
MPESLDNLDISQVLKLYEKQQEQNEIEYTKLEKHIENIQVSHSEIKQLNWDIAEKNETIRKLRETVENVQLALLEERKNHLAVVADNDKLKTQVNPADYENTPSSSNYHRKRARNTTTEYDYSDDLTIKKLDSKTKDILIENETLNMTVDVLKIQLEEQKANFNEMISSLTSDLENIKSTERVKNNELMHQVETATTRLYNIQSLYRENIKEMLAIRKSLNDTSRFIDHDHHILNSKINKLQLELRNKDALIQNLQNRVKFETEINKSNEIKELETRLQQSRNEFTDVQNEMLLEETNYKQNLSRLELINEKLLREIKILKSDHSFYLNSLFSESVQLKKSLSELSMSLSASGGSSDSIHGGFSNLANQDIDSKSPFFFCLFNLFSIIFYQKKKKKQSDGLYLETRRSNAPYPEIQTDHFYQYTHLNSR